MRNLAAATQDLVEFAVEDALVLVRPGQAGLFLLNSTSRFIWEMLRKGLSLTEIETALSDEFDIPKAQAANDLGTLLATWEETIWSADISQDPSSNDPAAMPEVQSAAVYDCIIHGRRFRLRISDPELEQEIRCRFDPLLAPDLSLTPESTFELTRDHAGYLLSGPHGVSHYSGVVTHARVGLIQEMVSMCFPERRWIAALHSAAVSGGGNKCILLCAASGGGKSTLTAALAANAKWAVLTDDLAFLDREKQEIATIPAAIMLRADTWPVLRPYVRDIDRYETHARLGEPVRYMPLRLSETAAPKVPEALVFLEFRLESHCSLECVSTFEALTRLNETRSWLDADPTSVPVFLKWLEAIPKWELTYGDLLKAAQAIDSI
jgi:hypothetical protein